jgi:hypothetical protein
VTLTGGSDIRQQQQMEQKHNDDALSVNPIVARLVKGAGTGSVIGLTGFVGPSEGVSIRLYESLSLDRYLDIPKDSVLHSLAVPDDAHGQVTIYVRSDAKIRAVAIMSATVSASVLKTQTEKPCDCQSEPPAQLEARRSAAPSIGGFGFAGLYAPGGSMDICNKSCLDGYIGCRGELGRLGVPDGDSRDWCGFKFWGCSVRCAGHNWGWYFG